MTCSRTVTILGATGSIGRSATDLLTRNRDRFRVEAVAAGHDAQALARVARDLDARFAAIADESAYRALQEALTGTGIETAAGPEAVIAAAERGADIVIGAIVGIAGLDPVLAAAKAGAVLALANKEALVCAGPILLEAARKAGTRILPVDSEHNAIFQVFEEANRSHIRRLVLTASGGPFR
ncbi:MAG: 1-deoxy-D-xylulose-5-phosphate reductoisomerase, partial [Pseudomonadota bacterium]|nr:1-deoxy-D-xylulose-5-phosphate reductoisomerase [Pseudomonadota bacterium]